MFVWNYCTETLCMLFVLSMVSSQQSIEENLDFRNQFSTSKSESPKPSKISRNEQSRKAVSPQSAAVVVIPGDQYEEDPQKKLEHPNLISLIETQLQDHNDNIEGNKYQDQQQKRQNAELDGVIQQIFSPNSIQEYKNRDLIDIPYSQAELPMNITKEDHVNLKQSFSRSNPYNVVVIKGGLRRPTRNILERKLLLKRLRSPMFRSGQSNYYSNSEQSSDELLHNILESIDQENSENGNPIKHAFLTKTTTYNISKLHEDGRNRSFLIEKLVNYSTNINMLHSENNIPTNYSDTHSSVLQTVLNLGQHDKNTDDVTNNEEDVSTEDSKMLRKLPENSPTEFLGGQYLQPPNKSTNITSKQTDKKDTELSSSDFVGMADKKENDLLESKDLKNNLLDFVGGQFVKQPLNSEEKPSGTSSLDFENISGNSEGIETATDEDNETPTTVTDETTHNPLPDILSLSLTKELVDVKESKDQSSSNVLKKRGKIEKPVISEGEDSKAVNTPKNPHGSKNIMTTEGDKNTLPKSNINTDKKKTPHPSSIDGNSNPQDYNLNPQISILGNPALEIQSDNDYESTTFTDGIQDKVTMPPGDKKRQFEAEEFQMEKKIQVSTPKPVFDDNYKKPSKAISAETKIIKLTNSIENNLSSEISEFKTEKNIKELFETTTTTDDDSLYDHSSLTSVMPKDAKKSNSLTEYKDVFLQSEEVPDLPKGVALQSSHESPQSSSNSKSNASLLPGLSRSDEEDNKSSEESVEGQSASTPEESELLSTEKEEYTDTSKAFVGLKPTNSYGNILRTDSATGTFVTETIDGYNPSEYTTQGSFEELESVSTKEPTFKSEILLPHSDREFDRVIGEASDIQQSKLGSDLINTESRDQLGSEQLSQEQNITDLIDEVELYAGKATVSEPVTEDQTTQNYDSGTNDIYKHSFEIVSSDSSEENITELCLPLTRKNYPTLLDLLSGKLYLEKDGKKMNLQLKDNPMKNCNSGTKTCKLFFDLKKSSEPAISEEMFEITKGLESKSKNGKRHISDEYAELMKCKQKTERNAEENSGEITEGTETRKELSHKIEDVILLTVNKTATNKSVSDFNQTEISGFTKAPSSMKLPPVQSMFVRLPVPYKTLSFGVQNTHKAANDNEHEIASQINREKITLHNLDSPYYKLGFPIENRLARKIHQKRDSYGQLGGACGCNNPLLLSPSPVPDYRHFVGKRLAILKNIVHTVKDWATQDSLRP